jgi:hypothetical protein
LAVRLMLVAVALFALSAPARADIDIDEGNNPQTDENVLLDKGTSGTEVFGQTNQTAIQVRFSTTEAGGLTLPSNGQARVEGGDGTLNNVTVDVPGGSFTSLIFNLNNGDGDVTITVSAVDGNGDPEAPVSETFSLKNGSNFFTIVASNNERILSVTIDAEDGADDMRQVRIGGAVGTVVPEPSTMALALIGVAGLGLKGLRRLRRRPATAPA